MRFICDGDDISDIIMMEKVGGWWVDLCGDSSLFDGDEFRAEIDEVFLYFIFCGDIIFTTLIEFSDVVGVGTLVFRHLLVALHRWGVVEGGGVSILGDGVGLAICDNSD